MTKSRAVSLSPADFVKACLPTTGRQFSGMSRYQPAVDSDYFAKLYTLISACVYANLSVIHES